LPLLREIQFFGDVLAFEIPSAIRFRNASRSSRGSARAF
jgi:hypothetical protein